MQKTNKQTQLCKFSPLFIASNLTSLSPSDRCHWEDTLGKRNGQKLGPLNVAESSVSLRCRCLVSRTAIHAFARNTSGWEKRHLRYVYTAPPARFSNSRFTQQFDGCWAKKKDFCSSWYFLFFCCGRFLTDTFTVLTYEGIGSRIPPKNNVVCFDATEWWNRGCYKGGLRNIIRP